MHQGFYPVTVVACQPGSALERPEFEIYLSDRSEYLALPENPHDELLPSRFKEPRHLTDIYEYVIINQPHGMLTARVHDASRKIMCFRATGDAIKHLRYNIAPSDGDLLDKLDAELKKNDTRLNGDERKASSADRVGVTASVSDPLCVDETLGMPRTFLNFRVMINKAASQPDYNPRTAWQPVW